MYKDSLKTEHEIVRPFSSTVLYFSRIDLKSTTCVPVNTYAIGRKTPRASLSLKVVGFCSCDTRTSSQSCQYVVQIYANS